MRRNVEIAVEGFIGASRENIYRMNPTINDEEWLRGLNSGQRVMMVMDLFRHVIVDGDFTAGEDFATQRVLERLEMHLIGHED